MEAQAEHKTLTVEGALSQWREWTHQLLEDARTALTVARHDIDRARKAFAGLRSNSQLLAYVQGKLKGETAKPKRGRKAAK